VMARSSERVIAATQVIDERRKDSWHSIHCVIF
jgi:hypothetical protein